MRQVLPGLIQKVETSQDTIRWINLPYLCCQAAGGDPHWADSLAAAWYLLLTAAHIMDKVEDQDEADPSWAPHGPETALGAATGLFFTASMALQKLYQADSTRLAASDAITDFYAGFLRMSSGQHADIIIPEPTLEQYWEIARDKSGAFFQIACCCGARLGGASPNRIKDFAAFGEHLGILKQILDDLDDLRPPNNGQDMRRWPSLARSLPIVYALSVLPMEERSRLTRCLQAASHDPLAAREAFRLLEGSGAALYLGVEIERHRNLAVESIQRAAVGSDALPLLITLLNQPGTSPISQP